MLKVSTSCPARWPSRRAAGRGCLQSSLYDGRCFCFGFHFQGRPHRCLLRCANILRLLLMSGMTNNVLLSRVPVCFTSAQHRAACSQSRRRWLHATPKPRGDTVRYGFRRAATLSRCRPPGRLVDHWMTSRMAARWDHGEKYRRQAQAPFHVALNVCEGKWRHHLMPPVRF